MLQPLLTSVYPGFDPEQTKIHFAQHNGSDDPLDVYFAGKFDDWQAWQRQKNFERPLLLSLVQMPRWNKWLFVGAYDSLEAIPNDEYPPLQYHYRYRKVEAFRPLEGRLVIHHEKTARANYRNLETCLHELQLSEIREERLTIGPFPGFKDVNVSYPELRLIVNQELESWRTALSSVAGVYLISDREQNQLYVGSATGMDGIWGRWVTYAHSGHGGNVRLVDLEAVRGGSFSEKFHFSILEIADKHTGADEMRDKENHWKVRLLTRDSGLNGN
ncbi:MULTISPECIES: GIY-YIG nuclease family protein [Pseudomonas]|uniref:GIY-YIG nuclease family protein n=1 Tax=Pseudomonas TaxID=286 RepID=UPI0015A33F92|nr:GIY-YIG nuclease family protein [Pseudomonas gingeri]NWA01378.1 GIY-YIG nuclease family protein [Pseudomonas gingeri]NWA13819.1 GIY-YIG nuclease family protein [Pseudomonas gingeri]NWA52821.1 GIY-YIG nuclease family protein [Pseudomonas gingeri]NWA96318.1 GIY-YIG nuclease family protein [Pseudomonas gingeri]NWB00046.1 GIY-YIG nuclease family protein [Pseudomonas gingeri]